MNPNYTDFRFPQIKAHPWHKVIAYSGSALLLSNNKFSGCYFVCVIDGVG